MTNTIDLIVRMKKTGTGGEEARKELGGLQKAAKIAGAALATGVVVQGAKAAWELAELGAQSLRTKRAFEAISGGALNAAGNLDAMRRATRGAMSEQAMMASANQLLQMGLADNADELEQVTTMATRLGSAMGKSAGPAVAEFSLMLANQSIPRLDTFGISASKVRARILELQAATPGLSREMAFMQATMEEGEEAMGRLGETIDDELLANERLEASWADLKAMSGEMLAPAMADVAEALAGVTRQVMGQVNELDIFTATYGKAAVEAQVLKHGLWETAAASEEFNQMMADAAAQAEGVAAAVEGGRTRIDGWSSALLVTAEASEVAAGSMDGLATSAKTVASSFGEMDFDDEQLWKMAAASGASLDELETLAEMLGIASSAEIEATKDAYALVEAFGEGTLSAEDLEAGFSELETASIEAQGGFEGLSNDAVILEKALADAAAMAEAVADAINDIPSGIGGVGGGGGRGGGVPEMQAGTTFHRGGLAILGEAGPELVALPRGTRAWPANAPETRAAVSGGLGGDTYNYYIDDRLAMALALEQSRRRRISRIERM